MMSAQIERYIRPQLGGMAVADVTRDDVRSLHRRTTDTGGPIAGNRIVSLLAVDPTGECVGTGRHDRWESA